MDHLETYEKVEDRYAYLCEELVDRINDKIEAGSENPVDAATRLSFACRIWTKEKASDYRDIAAILIMNFDAMIAVPAAYFLDTVKHRHSLFVRKAMESIYMGRIEINQFTEEVFPEVMAFGHDPEERQRQAAEFLAFAIILPETERSDILIAKGRYATIENQDMKRLVGIRLHDIDQLIGEYICT